MAEIDQQSERFDQFSNRIEVYPWTDIQSVPLPESDSTDGGRYFNNMREISVGDGGDNVFRMDQQGIWLGAAEFDDAPFKVSMLGAVTAESLTVIGGTITGAILRTDSTGARVVIDGSTTNNKRFYTVDGNGNEVVTIWATDGAHGIGITKAADSGIENCLRIVDRAVDTDDVDNGTVFVSVSPGSSSSKPVFSVRVENSNFNGQIWKVISSGSHTGSGDQMFDISVPSDDARVLVVGAYSTFHLRGDGRVKIKSFTQSAEPTTSDLDNLEMAVWVDSDDNSTYLLINQNSTIKKVQFT